MSELKRYRAYGNVDWQEGWCSGMIYGQDSKLTSLLAKVFIFITIKRDIHLILVFVRHAFFKCFCELCNYHWSSRFSALKKYPKKQIICETKTFF